MPRRASGRTRRIAAFVAAWLGLHGLAAAQPQEEIDWIPGSRVASDLRTSADGRFIAWSRPDAVGGTTNLIIHDRQAGDRFDLPLPMATALAPIYGRVYGFYGDGAGVVIVTGWPLVFDADMTMCTPPADDCNGRGGDDVYLVPLDGGAITRASLTTTGDEVPPATVFGAAVSYDGRRIAIVGDRHVLPDSNGFNEVYVRDLRGPIPQTIRITLDLGGDDPDGPVQPELAISPDGNVVAFASMASDLVAGDTNGTWDVFVAEVGSGRIQRVSVRSDGSQVTDPSGHMIGQGPQISLSWDGRYVAFMSAANDLDGTDVNAAPDIFIHDRVTLETTIATGDIVACGTRDAGNYGPSLSWDGQVLAFLTRDPCYSPMPLEMQAAVIHLVTRETAAVSVPLDGSMPDGPVEFVAISGHGDRVTFASEAQNLSMPGPPPEAFLRSAYTTMPFRDRDGDGLLDDWEELGVDVGGDGTLDLDLAALGARSDHKDLFVEIDWMRAAGHWHLPSAIARQQVVDAFDDAPVDNPDGSTGVRLHLRTSDSLAEAPDNVPLEDMVGLQRIKRALFGDARDRERGAEQRLAARRLAFRYLLMAHHQTDVGSSGLAERPGDDFIATLGAFTDQVGTVDEQAGTLMHELGHTLGLRHGGLDSVNCKPNYLSVMSYTFQFPDLVPGRPLDYGYALPTLVELILDENVGIDGPAGSMTVFGPPQSVAGGPFRLVRAPGSGPIDWDQDGDPTETGVARNINNLGFGGCMSAGGEDLVARDDWPHIIYDFRRTPGYGEGVSVTPESAEITRAILDEMRALRGPGANQAPVAFAGAAVTMDEETTVTLASAGSSDPEGAPITFHWMQADGPAGTLSATDVASPSFTAPRVDGDVTLPVELAVHDGQLFSVPVYTLVTVIDRGGPPADAGPAVDAGPVADAGPAVTDAGPGGAGGGGGGGCGCGVARAPSTPGTLALAGLTLCLVLWRVRRRRRLMGSRRPLGSPAARSARSAR